jgi:acyl-CoA thioesterase-1
MSTGPSTNYRAATYRAIDGQRPLQLGTRRRILKRAAALCLIAASPLATRRAGAAGPEPCRIAILGDSLTAGYGVALEEAFPVRLEAALREAGHACEIIDAGVSGDTSAGGRARLDWVLGDDPTHLLVELGGNDALRALPVDAMEANLAAIIEGAQARGVSVMLLGMLAPPNLGSRYTEAFAAVFPRLAERYAVPLYPFFLDGVAADPAYLTEDGIHPNAAGVARIVERLLPSVEIWLDESAD